MSSKAGKLFIMCGPSGVGKTTLAHHLLRTRDDVIFSVSFTTRAMRAGERDGVDYHFVEIATYEAMIERGEFAEYAKVHGNYYGTAVATIEEAWENGKHVIFDIDVQGARQLRERFHERAIIISIIPPSFAELERRLIGRATDDADVVKRRLAIAQQEMQELSELANETLVNADRDTACEAIAEIFGRLM